MTEHRLEDLARQAASGDRHAVNLFLDRLRDLFGSLDQDTLYRTARSALELEKERTAPAPAGITSGVSPLLLTGNGHSPTAMRLTPELRAWALQQYTEEELVAGLRAMREHGGLELRDFIHELEDMVGQQ